MIIVVVIIIIIIFVGIIIVILFQGGLAISDFTFADHAPYFKISLWDDLAFLKFKTTYSTFPTVLEFIPYAV